MVGEILEAAWSEPWANRKRGKHAEKNAEYRCSSKIAGLNNKKVEQHSKY